MRALRLSLVLCALGTVAWSAAPTPQDARVRHTPGTLHGLLALRSIDGANIGDGDLVQTVAADHLTTRTTFHFHDGSLNDETAVFSARGSYRLLRYRLVQSGAMFEHPLTLDLDMATGKVVVHSQDPAADKPEKKDKVEEKTMKLPADLGNGLLITLLQDLDPKQLPLSVPLLVATPDLRVVKLVVTNAGSAPFATGRIKRTATDYLVKTEIGGIAGVVAPIVGKQPPDAHVWILGGDAPLFIKSEAPLVAGGPLIRTELASPTWPR